MQPFLTDDGREYFLLRLERPQTIDVPFDAPYPCLIWAHGDEWSAAERSSVVESLLRTNCRYAVCGGVGCERWHDEIDQAFVTAFSEVEQDARFIMTSWHTGEPVLEVAWFFAWNTNFDDHDFRRFLVVELGTGSPEESLEMAIRRAVTESEAVLEELDQRAG